MIELPLAYYLAVGLFGLLVIYAACHWNSAWSLPYIAVLGTVAAWYFLEPFYFTDLFATFEPEYIESAYNVILIFLLSFAVIAPVLTKKFRPRDVHRSATLARAYVPAEYVLLAVAGLWLVLLGYGTLRMQGDLLYALFPLEGRAGARMWSRAAADAGPDGFIVSTASYLYSLCMAAFGLLYFLLPPGRYRILAVFLILISWPYAFLQGSRNIALATVLPAMISYILFSRQSFWVKIPIICGSLAVLDLAFKIMISYRNIGFGDIDLADAEGARHLGLNMASELVYSIKFLTEGTLDLTYGSDYLAELGSLIPRAIWPGKPMIGIAYAVARGFGGADNDIGVSATISSGVIGQGVQAFGTFFGPVAAAFLMSVWVGLLARFRAQQTPLRLSLYLVGLGLTFNLGRDITFLVLWPLVFGYVAVRLVEWNAKRKALVSSGQRAAYRSGHVATPRERREAAPPRR